MNEGVRVGGNKQERGSEEGRENGRWMRELGLTGNERERERGC